MSSINMVPKDLLAVKRDHPDKQAVGGKNLAASQSLRIRTLIVEDDESFLSVLTNVLDSSEYFSTVACETGEEAIQELIKNQFDLVILDHKMPGVSGLNVLQWMHEQKLQTPVIMITGAGSETIAVEAMKLGAYDYIRKDQFERQHFPIIASGVYERFLFRKQRDTERGRINLQEKNLAPLKSLHQSVASLTLTINSALAAISLMTEDCEGLVSRLAESDEKEELQNYFLEMRQEYGTVATITKSIVEFTRLMFDRLAGIVDVE